MQWPPTALVGHCFVQQSPQFSRVAALILASSFGQEIDFALRQPNCEKLAVRFHIETV
jgi:hypothetical protein